MISISILTLINYFLGRSLFLLLFLFWFRFGFAASSGGLGILLDAEYSHLICQNHTISSFGHCYDLS